MNLRENSKYTMPVLHARPKALIINLLQPSSAATGLAGVGRTDHQFCDVLTYTYRL